MQAVQTLVAIGDIRPREVLPILSLAFVSGHVEVRNKTTLSALSSSSSSSTLLNNDEDVHATKTASGTAAATMTDNIKLSQEQRIKLAEALMFIIRRRAATDEYVPLLVNVMIFGSNRNDRIGDMANTSKKNNNHNNDNAFGQKSIVKQRRIQQNETHRYFLGLDENDDDNNDNNNDGSPKTYDDGYELTTTTTTMKKERWEEQDIRLRTGGPIFTSEEIDVVRAGRVSVLAELLSVSKSYTIASHCHIIVRLSIDVLRLETSRVVCRAAALLIRELFACVLREQYDDNDDSVPSDPFRTQLSSLIISNGSHLGIDDENEGRYKQALALTRALISSETNASSRNDVASDEEVLVSILQAHAFGQGPSSYDDDGTRSTNRRAQKIAMADDPTTSVRCREALELRNEANRLGLFAAARLMIVRQEADNSIPSILTSPSRKSSKAINRIIEID